jgi:hypothetical protein
VELKAKVATDPYLREAALRKLRHELAGAVMVLHAAGEKDLAEQCRDIVRTLDQRLRDRGN